MQILVALAVAATLGGGAFVVTEAVQSRTEAESRVEAGTEVETNTHASSTIEQDSLKAQLIHFLNLEGSGNAEPSELNSQVKADAEADASVETGDEVRAKTNVSGSAVIEL